jgi:hypothetical protein
MDKIQIELEKYFIAYSSNVFALKTSDRGRVPQDNIGWSTVKLMKTMEIPEDLK